MATAEAREDLPLRRAGRSSSLNVRRGSMTPGRNEQELASAAAARGARGADLSASAGVLAGSRSLSVAARHQTLLRQGSGTGADASPAASGQEGFKDWLAEQVRFSESLAVPAPAGRSNEAPGKAKGGFGALRALSRLGSRKAQCSFSMYVHGASSLPASAEGKGLVVRWHRKGMAVGTNSHLVHHGVARVDQLMHLSCTVFFSVSGQPPAVKCQSKPSVIDVRLVGDSGTAPVVLAEHHLDLAALVPTSLNSPGGKPTTVSFPLSREIKGSQGGKGAAAEGPVLLATFGYEVELVPGRVQVAVADAHAFSASSLLSSAEPSPRPDLLSQDPPTAFASIAEASEAGEAGEASEVGVAPEMPVPVSALEPIGGGVSGGEVGAGEAQGTALKEAEAGGKPEEGVTGTGASAETTERSGEMVLGSREEGIATEDVEHADGALGGPEKADVRGDVSFQPWAKHIVFSVPEVGLAVAPEAQGLEKAQAEAGAGASTTEDGKAEAEAGEEAGAGASTREDAKVEAEAEAGEEAGTGAWAGEDAKAEAEAAAEAQVEAEAEASARVPSVSTGDDSELEHVKEAVGSTTSSSSSSSSSGSSTNSPESWQGGAKEGADSIESSSQSGEELKGAPESKGAQQGQASPGDARSRSRSEEDEVQGLLSSEQSPQKAFSPAAELGNEGGPRAAGAEASLSPEAGPLAQDVPRVSTQEAEEAVDLLASVLGGEEEEDEEDDVAGAAADVRGLTADAGDDGWGAAGAGSRVGDTFPQRMMFNRGELGGPLSGWEKGEVAVSEEEGACLWGQPGAIGSRGAGRGEEGEEGEEETEEEGVYGGEEEEEAALAEALREAEAAHRRAGLEQQSRERARKMLEVEESAARRKKFKATARASDGLQEDSSQQKVAAQEDQGEGVVEGREERETGLTSAGPSGGGPAGAGVFEFSSSAEALAVVPRRKGEVKRVRPRLPGGASPGQQRHTGGRPGSAGSARPTGSGAVSVEGGGSESGLSSQVATQSLGQGSVPRPRSASAGGNPPPRRSALSPSVKERVLELEASMASTLSPGLDSPASRAHSDLRSLLESEGVTLDPETHWAATHDPGTQGDATQNTVSQAMGVATQDTVPQDALTEEEASEEETLVLDLSQLAAGSRAKSLRPVAAIPEGEEEGEGEVGDTTRAFTPHLSQSAAPTSPRAPPSDTSIVVRPPQHMSTATASDTGNSTVNSISGGVPPMPPRAVLEGVDLRQLIPGAADPLSLALPDAPGPPALVESLGPAIPTAQGGTLVSMSGEHFQPGASRLLMQFSRPMVIPEGMGATAPDVMRTLALALESQTGDICEQLQGLMPLPELAGVPLEQIAAEGLLHLEDSARASGLGLAPAHRSSLEGSSPHALLGQATGTGGAEALALSGPRHLAALTSHKLQQGEGAHGPGVVSEVGSTHWRQWVQELGKMGSGSAGALALLNSQHDAHGAPLAPPCESTALQASGTRGALVAQTEGVVGESVGVHGIAPLAVGELEALAIEGLRIQSGEASASAPASIPLSALLAAGPLPLEGSVAYRGSSTGVGSATGGVGALAGPPPLGLITDGSAEGWGEGMALVPRAAARPSDPVAARLALSRLLEKAVTLEDWQRTAGGAPEAPQCSPDTLAVLAAHNAIHGPVDAVSKALLHQQGPLVDQPHARGVLLEKTPGESGMSVVSGDGVGGDLVAGQGSGGSVTVAMLVQLRDPVRNFEPVGAPMLALMQAEAEAEPGGSGGVATLQFKAQAALPSAEQKGDEGSTEGVDCGCARGGPVESEKHGEGASGGTGETQGQTEGARGGQAGGARFKLVGVHMMGLKTAEGSRRAWGAPKAKEAGSRWVAAQGMSKRSKGSGGSKVGGKSRGKGGPEYEEPMSPVPEVMVRPGDTMWSLSQKVHGSGAKWREVAKLNPHIRNPDLILPDQKIRMV